MHIEKLTTSLQLIGAALAVPAGIAGVYSAYHNYFSPEVRCQEMRNAALVTLEKNIPTEAKRALLRNDVSQFQAKCAEVEPETAMVFQVALQELDKPAPAPAAAPKPAQKPAAQTRSVAATALAAAATTPVTAPANAAAPPTNIAPPAAPAWAAAAPAAPAPASALAPPAAVQPAPPANLPAARPTLAPGPAVASLGPMARFTRPVRGWVAIEVRRPGKAAEAFFSGYPADGQSVPPPGTILTAMAFRPIWSEPQGQGPIDPTKLQGRIKVGECVRVLTAAASLGRQWAEVEPAACP